MDRSAPCEQACMDNVQGKVAVITGAASVIGLAVAKRAAADGMKVVLADIEERALGDAARTLAATGAEVLAVVTDVSDGSSVEALRDRTLEREPCISCTTMRAWKSAARSGLFRSPNGDGFSASTCGASS